MTTLKKFAFCEDAELACHQLLAAGIQAKLVGENGNALFGSIMAGGFCIEVDETDKDQATLVLEEMGQADDISDEELEAMAMAEPGIEKEVEPSDFEPEPSSDPATVGRVWRGLCWGCGIGLAVNLVIVISSANPMESLGGIAWRLPAFGFFGALLAGMKKPEKTGPPEAK